MHAISSHSRLAGGTMASAISEAMVQLHREHFGRGPGGARTLVADDVAICILSDVFTTAERSLLRVGMTDAVREQRLTHHRAAEREFVEPIERLTGNRVLSFSSTVTFDPDQAIEIFTFAGSSPRA